MTREEAIEVIKDLIDTYVVCHGEEDMVAVSLDNVDVEALDMAIKALEQETCEDAISRKTVIDELNRFKNDTTPISDTKDFACNHLLTFVEKLTPVQPKPKTGHWIRHETDYGIPLRECSVCREWFEWNMPKNSFCPNCGAKMFEPQESEDKE